MSELELPDPLHPDLPPAPLSKPDLCETARAALRRARAFYEEGSLARAAGEAEGARGMFGRAGDALGGLEATTLLGRIARDEGRLDEAARCFGVALDLARGGGDAEHESNLQSLLAGVLSDRGDYAGALELLAGALALAQAHGLTERRGVVLSNMGTLYTLLGNPPRALEALTEAYALLRQAAPGSPAETMNHLSLGGLYEALDNPAEARRFFTYARESGRALQNPLIEAAALNNLANVALGSGEHETAQRLFTDALTLARRVGLRGYEIDNLDGLGETYSALGNAAAASESHAAALAIAREIGDAEGETDALLNLGGDYLRLGDPERARRLLHEGLALAQAGGRQPAVFAAHRRLSEVYEALGEPGVALAHFKAFHEAEKAVFNAENERRTRHLSVHFELERAHDVAAKERLRSDLLKSARDEAEAQVRRRTDELVSAQLEVVTRLAVAAEYRDDNTGEHTKRVGRNAAAIAHALGWPSEEVELLFLAARLHDVGKLAVPDAVLHKPGRLEPAERHLMQMHTVVGARILSAGRTRLLKLAEEVALSHHERWDGTGYPHGLVAEAAPPSARVVAVADVLDALVHTRPYKGAWSVADALREIAEGSGRQFDPAVVRACLTVFGPGGRLSPLETPDDLASTLARLRDAVPSSGQGVSPG